MFVFLTFPLVWTQHILLSTHLHCDINRECLYQTRSSTLITNKLILIVITLNLFQVIKRANNNRYGLSASVWSTDVGKVHRIAKKIHVCTQM